MRQSCRRAGKGRTPADRYEVRPRRHRIGTATLLVEYRIRRQRCRTDRVPHTGSHVGSRPQTRQGSRMGLGQGHLRPLDSRRIRGTRPPVAPKVFLACQGGHQPRRKPLERYKPLVDGYPRLRGVAGRMDRRERHVEQGRDGSGKYPPCGPLSAQDVRRRRQGQARRTIYLRSGIVGDLHKRRTRQRRRSLTYTRALLVTRIL